MDPFIILVIVVGIMIASYFNYLLNRAPGSDPDDFQVGPSELNITCDCYLNTLIIGGIVVIAIAASSSYFDGRLELYTVGILAFTIITVAGILGRRQRYAEWRELHKVFKRVVKKSKIKTADAIFDEDPEDY